MTGELAATYKSNSQRARVVTESWGEHNLYCPNCSSLQLSRLSHNTAAADFSCPKCKFWFQLKGQQKPIGNSITDGAYEAMMRAIRSDDAPSYYFMHYDVATWTIRNLLLVPHFAFPPSAIVKRPPLAATARRAGWVGCNFALNRIPADARIPLVTTIKSSPNIGGTECLMIAKPEQVREKFQQVKKLKDVPQRGWVLDVLNIVRRITGPDGALGERRPTSRQDGGAQGTARPTFTNEDVYAYERELAALHPDNRHIRPKIRQQLQVLRDTGFLTQLERGHWQVK
jgi:type II restriction enzyme